MCDRSSMTIIGHKWERHGKTWERQLLRQCNDCEGFIIDDLTYVQADYPYCLTCLSQSVRLDASMTARCTQCGAVVQVLEDVSPEV